MATMNDKLTMIIFFLAWISVGIYVFFLGDLLQRILGIICMGLATAMGVILYRYYFDRPNPPSAHPLNPSTQWHSGHDSI
ncbi:MAG: hypothetical protein ACFFD6_04615 [Candidatus Thorarchaeota archaeon]